MKISTIIGNTKFSFDLLLLILLIFIPAKLVLIIIVSIFLHELGHYITANILKYNVTEFRISLLTSFVQFEEKITKPIDSLLISLSGPFMNLLLMIYSYNLNLVDLLSINFILFVINLIPLRTTDGNHSLKAILDLIKIKNTQKISNIVGIIISVLLIGSMFIIGEYIMAFSLILMALSLNITK